MRVWVKLATLWNSDERLRFLATGAINTALGYTIFALYFFILTSWLHYLIIAALSHATAVSIAFMLHRRLVFRSTTSWGPAFIRYNISLSGIFLWNIIGLYLLVSAWEIYPLFAQAIVLLTSVITSYFAHRHFSFRNINKH
jgi:putative flippase GtrA